MKKHIFQRRLLLIPLLLLSCLVLFAACNNGTDGQDGTGIVSIAFSDSDQPQTSYVEGQELNRAKGSLVVVRDNGLKETVALNAEGVTITGYDKTVLGEQSLVISYKGKSISLTVSVSKRMTITGYETNYFVGDSINTKKGKIVIVKDDGTKVSLRMDDPEITVVNFDSATAGQGKQATVRYSAGGVEYTDTIAVNVYDFGNVKFTKPTKTIYGNHEQTLNLQGGYFVITAKDNEQLTKNIPLTQLSAEMITGYDPSAATRENINDPLSQTITISYAGNIYTYKISLLYSGVSIMQDVMEQVKDFDITAAGGKITEEDGLAVIEGMMAYVDLAPADRELLDQNGVEKVARMCAYCAPAYANVLASSLYDAIIVSVDGISLAENSTYETVVEAYMMLTSDTCAITTYSDFMAAFVADFGTMVLQQNVTIGQYVRYVSTDNWKAVASLLDLILQAHDDMSEVPDDWTVESLEQYGEAIDSAVMHLTSFPYSSVISPVCQVISSWRAKNDYLDIIYCYYYNYLPGMLMEETWGRLPLPKELEEIYTLIYQASTFSSRINSMGAQSLWYDTGYMHLYYYMAMQKSEELMQGNNQLYKDLYEFIDFQQLIDNYILYPTTGVVNLMSAGYADKELTQLMETYMALLASATGDNTLSVTNHNRQLQELFDGFALLTPSKQSAFLSALFYDYGMENVRDKMALTFTDGETAPGNLLVSMFQLYFTHYLPDDMIPVVQDLLHAMEYYVNRERYDNAKANFMAKMEAVSAAYSALSMENKALFDQYLGTAYAKYNTVYRLEKNGQSVSQDQYIHLFNELAQSIRDYLKIRTEVTTQEGQVVPAMLGMSITAFEHIESVMAQIKALNNHEINALLALTMMTTNDGTEMNLDYSYMNARYGFLVMMHNLSFTNTNEDGTQEKVVAWKLYAESGADVVMQNAYYVMMARYNGTQMDAQTVLNIMKQFRALMSSKIGSVYIFDLMSGDLYYYEGLQNFLNSVLSESNQTFGAKLLEAEKALCQYAYSRAKNEEALATFNTIMEELMEMHGKLTDAENFNTYLAEMYNFYLNQYQLIKNEAEA